MPVRNDTRRRRKEDEYYDQDHVPTKQELAYDRRYQELRKAGLLPGQLRRKGALEEETTASFLYLVGKKPHRDGIQNEPIDTTREGNEEVEEEYFDYYVEEKVYNLPKPRWEPRKPKEKKRRYKAD